MRWAVIAATLLLIGCGTARRTVIPIAAGTVTGSSAATSVSSVVATALTPAVAVQAATTPVRQVMSADDQYFLTAVRAGLGEATRLAQIRDAYLQGKLAALEVGRATNEEHARITANLNTALAAAHYAWPGYQCLAPIVTVTGSAETLAADLLGAAAVSTDKRDQNLATSNELLLEGQRVETAIGEELVRAEQGEPFQLIDMHSLAPSIAQMGTLDSNSCVSSSQAERLITAPIASPAVPGGQADGRATPSSIGSPQSGGAVIVGRGASNGTGARPIVAITTVPVGRHPVSLALDTTSHTVFVANQSDNTNPV